MTALGGMTTKHEHRVMPHAVLITELHADDPGAPTTRV